MLRAAGGRLGEARGGSGMLGEARGCSGMLGDGWVMLEISVRSEEASGKRAGDGWGKGQLSGADEP